MALQWNQDKDKQEGINLSAVIFAIQEYIMVGNSASVL